MHSVSVSIPDIASVVGFEAGDPAVLRRISRGYPRFRPHPWVCDVAALVAGDIGRRPDEVVLTRTARSARSAAAYAGLGPEAVIEARGLSGVVVGDGDGRAERVRGYVVHTGSHLSSRQAEDVLLSEGLLAAPQPETSDPDDPELQVRAALAAAYGARGPGDVSLHNSGMNAVYAALAAVTDVQLPRGRHRWVQLGTVFFDTVRLLEKRIVDVELDVLPDPFTVDALARLLAERGDRVAGIVTEVTSNPLLQTPDLATVRALAERAGCAVVLDATIATPHNVDVLAYADVVCESLTKCATGSADVLAGGAVVNGAAPHADALRAGLARHGAPPYGRDAARVADRIRGYAERSRRVAANTVALVDHFARQPFVRSVRWAYEGRSAATYDRVARRADAPGGLILLDLAVPIETVYDPLALPKGPSFGADFTMAAAQVFIAHFDLLSTAAGRARLAARGLHRDMLRVSVGTESPDQVAAAFDEAFSTHGT